MIYNKTVQLVIFYLYLMLHVCVQRFDMMEKERKNLEFGWHLSKALFRFGFGGRVSDHAWFRGV
jgi:hypothetical protein